MVTISRRSSGIPITGSIQFKLILTYIVLLAVLLIILNIYPVSMSRDLVFKSKESSLSGSASIVASALTGLEYLSTDGVGQVMEMLDEVSFTRLVITDEKAGVVYDSQGSTGYALYPEICQALKGNDFFRSDYNGSSFTSFYAQPIMYKNQVIGAVFAYDLDEEQAELLQNIQRNFKTISVVISIVFLIISVLFSNALTRRLQGIIAFLKKVGAGDYNQRLKVKGNDELAELGTEFNAFTERLRDTENARKRFVSDASHELKTPLASIKLLTDSIIQTENIDPDMAREFVSDIGEEADRLTRITEKLLDITRLEGASEKPSQPVELSEVVERALHTLRPLADSKGVELRSSMDADCILVTNADDIHQIIFNLIENAIKYNSPGGMAQVLLYKNPGEVVLIVEDDGIGIPQEDEEKIFDRFYRVDKARSREAGGTGLGLSIVKETVEKHGGRVTVNHREPKGTRFTVVFPDNKV